MENNEIAEREGQLLPLRFRIQRLYWHGNVHLNIIYISEPKVEIREVSLLYFTSTSRPFRHGLLLIRPCIRVRDNSRLSMSRVQPDVAMLMLTQSQKTSERCIVLGTIHSDKIKKNS